MTQDLSEDQPKPARHGGGRLLMGGVVVACVLGVGLGLWARPGVYERREGPPAPPRDTQDPVVPVRRLQIVVDDTPAPMGAPLEVMSPDMDRPTVRPPAPRAAPAPRPPEFLAPRRPMSGLMKVDTARLPAAPVPVIARSKIEPPKPPPEAPRVAKAPPRKVKAEVRLAKVERPRAKAEKMRVARLERPKPVKTARADKPAPQARELAEAPAKKRHGLAALVRAVKSAPKALREKEARLAAAKPERPTPIRVARVERCISTDPGEALVCANPRLGVRDRQLQRAYRDAEAAGVPASALRRQQDRWLAARAAAAREAPWAVEDVYEARIAELADLQRDARDGN